MKVLKFIGILILVLVAGYLILCLMGDKEMNVESKTTINAPKAVVWEQVTRFANWDNWSAFKEMDSTIVSDIKGTDGTAGSSYHFKGKQSGEGTATNMGMTADEMKYEMDFVSPLPAKADGYYKITDAGDGKTNVVWTFHENVSFIQRGLFVILGGTKMLKKNFDRGLELLKNYSEAHKGDMAATAAYDVQEVPYASHIYAGVRKTLTWAEMDAFFKSSYEMLGKALGARIAGPASNLVYMWDEKNMKADMMAAFPVTDKVPATGATMVEVPAGTAYMVKYTGGYMGIGKAHEAIGMHLAATKKEAGLVIEEYIKGPGDVADSNLYETNVYYMLK